MLMRETFEETGIVLDNIEYKGTISWIADASYSGGMYVFIAVIPDDYQYYTPKKVDEGILDWKDIEWIWTEGNLGVGEMIPQFLPKVLSSPECFEHKCILENNKLIYYDAIRLGQLEKI